MKRGLFLIFVAALMLVCTLLNVALTTSSLGIQAVKSLVFQEGTSPGTPSAGWINLYGKAADKKIYAVDSTGAETGMGGGAGTLAATLLLGADNGGTLASNQALKMQSEMAKLEVIWDGTEWLASQEWGTLTPE